MYTNSHAIHIFRCAAMDGYYFGASACLERDATIFIWPSFDTEDLRGGRKSMNTCARAVPELQDMVYVTHCILT